MPNPPIELDAFTQGLVDGPDNAYGMSYQDMANEYADTMKGMAEFVVPTTPEDLAMTIATGPVGGKVVGKLPLPKSAKQLRKVFEQLQDAMKEHIKKNGPDAVFPQSDSVSEVFQALKTAEWDEFFKSKADKWSTLSYEDLLQEEKLLPDEFRAAAKKSMAFTDRHATALKKALWDAQDEAVNAGRVAVTPVWKGKLYGKDTALDEFPVGSRVRFKEPQHISTNPFEEAAPMFDEGIVVKNEIFQDVKEAEKHNRQVFYKAPIVEFKNGQRAKFHPSYIKEFFPGLKPVK